MTHFQTQLRSRLCAAALLCLIGCDNREATEVPRDTAPATTEAVPESTPAETAESDEEEVVAWVNGEPLARGEVRRHLQRIESVYAARKRPLEGSQRALKRRLVTEKLIDQRLLSQWVAEHDRPPVASEEIDRALATRIEESFGDRSVLERHLARRGETLAEFRRDLREQIVLERLIAEADISDTDIDDTDIRGTTADSVERKFESVVARPPHEVRVRAASLFLPWPQEDDRDVVRDEVVAKATPVTSLDGFRRAAEALRQRWEIRYQEDTGWTELGQTASDVEKTLFATETGHVTEAIVTPLGIQLYFVRDREVRENPHLKRLKPVLKKRLQEEQFQHRRRALVDKLRKDAVIRWKDTEEVE